MNSDDPIAFFITWTVYGTHLQGDERGWRRRKELQQPQPRLVQWRRERLKHDVLLLSNAQRVVVEQVCQRHCDHRGWQLWAVNARTNHVHAEPIISSANLSDRPVREVRQTVHHRRKRRTV